MSAAAPRDAHAFQVALTEAIGAAVAEAGPRARCHDGVDLGPALARRLFERLVNDPEVAAGRPVAPATRLEADVVRRLGVDLRPPSPLARARASAAGERSVRHAARTSGSAGLSTRAGRGGVWFLVEHPKFLRLIGAVADALDQEPARLLWLGGDGRPPAHDGDPALDRFAPAGRASLRGTGSAARAVPDLVVDLGRARAALASLAPERLVICEGNSPRGAVVAAAARAAGIPVICLQQGWSPIVHAGFHAIPADRMTVWGEGFAELLAPVNPGLQLVVTGSPVLEAPAAEGTAELERLLAGRRAAGFFVQPLSPYITPAHQQALARLAADVAEAAPESALMVRPHPGYPLQALDVPWPDNVVFVASDRFALRPVLEASRAVVSIYSTSLVEGAAIGRPAVIFNPTDLPRYSPDLEALRAGIETEDPDGARAAIVAALGDDAPPTPGLATVRERYFAGLRGNAAQRAAAAITG